MSARGMPRPFVGHFGSTFGRRDRHPSRFTETAMTAELERTLSEVGAKIHRARISLVSDEKKILEYDDCVRTQLVSPVLETLGWDTDSVDEVKLNYPVGGVDGDSTLAIFLHGIYLFC